MIEQFVEQFKSQEPVNQAIFAGAVTLVLGALLAVMFWANAESYKPVYTSNDSSMVNSAKMMFLV